ncbi:unnamed protein product [Bursaphelenchus okinawaensis]|uniref:Nuclear receptor domain-containing protein n=1 Tax=Bursaphelenchus okinawaensis TaxID=465554 RepID=A0A811L8E7_9BILA|nr:unnamed protein product [Bursaphelenchus okinawaensis]CAG9119847.1 unnamed protein product [Bursaphelenchus okinawaensis]
MMQRPIKLEDDGGHIIEPLELTGPLNCLICGASGAKHYGTIACLGCKGFFRRSILLNKVYKCIRNKTCTMSPETRNGCHYCRLQKCYAVGMKTCYLQASRKSGSSRKIIDLSPKGSPTPPFLLVNQQLSKVENRCVSLGSLNAFKSQGNSSTNDIVQYFGEVERICDEVFDERTMDVDVDLAVSEPGRIAPRVDMEWGMRLPFTDDALKPIWCRQICNFFDYASFMPDMEMIDEKEKNRLILANSTRILSLTVAYKTQRLDHGVDAITFGLGFYYPVIEDQKPAEQTSFTELSRILFRDCIVPMREMHLSLAEYCIVKAMYFFSPVSTLSDRSLQIINRIREKYANVLNDYLLNEMGYMEAVERITKIHSILQVIEVTSNRFDKRMAGLVMVDSAGMLGRLSYDIHVRTN